MKPAAGEAAVAGRDAADFDAWPDEPVNLYTGIAIAANANTQAMAMKGALSFCLAEKAGLQLVAASSTGFSAMLNVERGVAGFEATGAGVSLAVEGFSVCDSLTADFSGAGFGISAFGFCMPTDK